MQKLARHNQYQMVPFGIVHKKLFNDQNFAYIPIIFVTIHDNFPFKFSIKASALVDKSTIILIISKA